MKKNLILCFSLFVILGLHAQQYPLQPHSKISSSDELLVVRHQSNKMSNQASSCYIYDFDSNLGIFPKDSVAAPALGPNFYPYQSSIATHDFNKDGKDDAVFIYGTDNNNLIVSVSDTALSNLNLNTTNYISINADLQQSISLASVISHTIGDFDGDGYSDLAIVWKAQTGAVIKVAHINFTTSLNPVLVGVYDGSSATVFNYIGGIAVSAADFDNDGNDELAIVNGSSQNGNPTLVLMDLQSQGFATVLTEEIVLPDVSNPAGLNVVLASGDPDADGESEVILASSKLSCSNCYDAFVQVINVATNLQSTFYNNNFSIKDYWGNYGADPNAAGPISLSIVCKDLNYDGRDDITIADADGIRIFEANNNGNLNQVFHFIAYTGSAQNEQHIESRQFMAVGDLNGDLTMEIAYMSHQVNSGIPFSDHNVQLRILSLNTDTWTILKNKIAFTEYMQSSNAYSYTYSLAFADADGDNIKLGEPVKHSFKNITQPIAVLNAPPLHFDKLGGVNYDVNQCYNTNTCTHEATYFWNSQATKSIEVSIKNGWHVSKSLDLGGSYAVFDIENKIIKSQKVSLSDFESGISTFQIINQVVAKDDDLIFATIADYDFWEYPVYVAGKLAGYTMLVSPTSISNQWIPSKNWTAQNYLPDHEHGHILSYKEYNNTLDNPYADQNIYELLGQTGYALNATSSYNWMVDMATLTNGNSLSNDVTVNLGSDLGIFNEGVFTKGDYDDGTLITHQTSIQSDFSLGVDIGSVDPILGITQYKIAPYMYWAKNGAFVLDYAAKPQLPSGSGSTWWTANYGQEQDPGFILPWRLDTEKGFTLSNPNKKYESKHIQIFPSNPSPGDTVTLVAHIHNFSLKATQDPVELSFYLGNPNANGQLLADVNAQTIFTTATALQPRASQAISMQWVYPSGLSQTQIYAYIDPNNNWTEIHESNNIGFNTIDDNSIGIDEPEVDTQSGVELLVYPNPAYGEAVVEFEVEKASQIIINIHDINGVLVQQQVNQNLDRGIYLTRVNTQNMKAGVYVVDMQCDTSFGTTKLMVVH